MPSRTVPAIRDLLAVGRESFSFEFMVPRTEAEKVRLWRVIRELEPLRPTFVSVTCNADGSTKDATVQVAGRIAEETTLTPMAYLTAVNRSAAELRHVIGSYAAVGVRNVLALRGDPPGNPTGEWHKHLDGLAHAEDLVRLVRRAGEFCVGVAAFPETHPRSPSRESDLEHFVRKVRAGADFAITKMFFYPEDYLRLRDEVTARGCHVPIIPGIIPIVSVRMIEHVLTAGCKFPPALADDLHRHADDKTTVRKIGVEYAAAMCQRLLAEGAPGLHFYTMNMPRPTWEIYELLSLGRRGQLSAKP
jgi:methylenetetrahydrofolate reductase (NADPH)